MPYSYLDDPNPADDILPRDEDENDAERLLDRPKRVDDDPKSSFSTPIGRTVRQPNPIDDELPPPPAVERPSAGLIGQSSPTLDPTAYSRAADRVAELAGQRPAAPQPKWWQRALAGGIGALAGMSNASGKRTPQIDPSGAEEAILAPGYRRKLGDWQRQVEGAQAQQAAEEKKLGVMQGLRKTSAETDLHTAEAEKNRATAKLSNQQAETLAIEGKRAPKGNFITVPGGGLYNADTLQWVKPAVDKSQVLELDPAWVKENMPMLKPDKSGSYSIPISAANALITTQGKKTKLNFEHFTDETTGDVTKIGSDPETGEIISRELIKGVAKKRPPTAISIGNLSSDDDVTFQAEQALITGKMPTFGGRNPVLASRVTKRMRELAAERGVDANQLPVLQSAYKANSDSLNKLTVQKNMIGTFEKTAGKNLDVFLQQAQNVIDTKSPILNRTFRGAQRELTGGLEGFDAARITAFTEVSRVLSGSMSSVLSDSARREAESIMKSDYTIPGLMRAVKVLRQDMNNRMHSYDEQINEVRGAMGGTLPAGNETGPTSRPPLSSFEKR